MTREQLDDVVKSAQAVGFLRDAPDLSTVGRDTMMRDSTELQTTQRPAKLAVEGVSKWFRTPRATVHALDDITLQRRDRRVRLPRRAERLRQIDAARHHRRADHAG